MTKEITIDTRHVFIVPKFYGAIISGLLGIMISLISYIYVTNDRYYKEQIYQIKLEMKELEIRQLSTVDALQDIHKELDILDKVNRHQTKYYRIQVRGEKNN